MWADQPLDQRAEMGGQAVFDSDPLAEAIEILGFSVLALDLAADTPGGLVAVTLCEVFPDGAATRVTYGLLNLTHRDGHERPEALETGRRYSVSVQLNAAAHRFEARQPAADRRFHRLLAACLAVARDIDSDDFLRWESTDAAGSHSPGSRRRIEAAAGGGVRSEARPDGG